MYAYTQVTSYGGKLSYSIYYDTGRYPAEYLRPGPDVIISVSSILLTYFKYLMTYLSSYLNVLSAFYSCHPR